jgi:predicted metal-dependent HD superfamily phosphohydrolase
MPFKQSFFTSMQICNADQPTITRLWKEIESSYTKPGRHYHTLTHLDAVLSELVVHRNAFANWHTIVFAIAYHDLIYNPLKNNNEEKSAALAAKRLRETGCQADVIELCSELILATKNHKPASREIDLFTDADLSILGSDPDKYKEYARLVRLEYSIYPDMIYKAGRKKVLEHFLAMQQIFKTGEFADRYESAARENLKRELQNLRAD